jgi:hypothetical protein
MAGFLFVRALAELAGSGARATVIFQFASRRCGETVVAPSALDRSVFNGSLRAPEKPNARATEPKPGRHRLKSARCREITSFHLPD